MEEILKLHLVTILRTAGRCRPSQAEPSVRAASQVRSRSVSAVVHCQRCTASVASWPSAAQHPRLCSSSLPSAHFRWPARTLMGSADARSLACRKHVRLSAAVLAQASICQRIHLYDLPSCRSIACQCVCSLACLHASAFQPCRAKQLQDSSCSSSSSPCTDG